MKTMVQALNDALRESMEEDRKVLVMGEDVGELGGVFRVTAGLQKDFGPERVFNSLLAESSIVGTSIGLAMRGFRPALEIQFDGFVYPAFNQIVSQLAKLYARTRGQVRLPVVVRLPVGGGIGAVEHHSESNEAYFAHTAGLRVVACSNPNDAYWMLRQSIRSDDPVIFYEPKRRYWSKGEVVADERDVLPLDRAAIVRPGTDLTLFTYGGMVHECLLAAEEAAADGRDVEVVDLRSLSPLDTATIDESVRRTKRAVVVHEAPTFLGMGSEIAAHISEHCFLHLEAPVRRVGGFNTPYPPAKLEEEFLPDLDRILDAGDRSFAFGGVMTVVEMRLPDVGEGLTEAEISRWLVAPGDTITLNQVVVEIETAKAVVELPSPFAGVVAELRFAAGETADVGAVLLTLSSNGAALPAERPVASAAQAAPAADEPVEVLVGYGPSTGVRRRRSRAGASQVEAPTATPVATAAVAVSAPSPASQLAAGRPLAKPKVRRLARDLGLELALVEPLENGTVVTEADVLRHASGGVSRNGLVARRVPIHGVRKAIATAVSRSAFTAPHVTEFLTVDVTETVELVNTLRADRRFDGLRATPLLVAARALCIAARELPDINANWDEEAQEIVVHGAVNLGIAAATPRGLIVPNIKGADSLDLVGLAGALDALVRTARSGATTVKDMSGGTLTITNVGVFGVDAATPILNPGESAILALGAIRRTPWVVGDAVVPRSTMQISLSFDHRLVDGELGSRFLTKIGDVLTHPLLELALT